jgi:hypothetical protein
MSCCVTPFILVKFGKKKLPNICRNLLSQSYWQNTICTEQGRSRFLRNKFLQDYLVYSPDSSPHNLRGANLNSCKEKFTWRSIHRLNVDSPTGYETLIHLWSGQVRIFFYMTSHLTNWRVLMPVHIFVSSLARELMFLTLWSILTVSICLLMIMAGKAYENWIDVQHCTFFTLTSGCFCCFSPQGKFLPSTLQEVRWTPEPGCEVWKRKSLAPNRTQNTTPRPSGT